MKRSSAVHGDRGATAVEYALVAGLVAVVALVGIVYVGRSLAGSFEESTMAIGAAVTGGDTAGGDTAGGDTAGGPETVTVVQPGTVAPPLAVWSASPGKSGKYEWVCANGSDLVKGKDKDKAGSATPPGPAPSCV